LQPTIHPSVRRGGHGDGGVVDGVWGGDEGPGVVEVMKDGTVVADRLVFAGVQYVDVFEVLGRRAGEGEPGGAGVVQDRALAGSQPIRLRPDRGALQQVSPQDGEGGFEVVKLGAGQQAVDANILDDEAVGVSQEGQIRPRLVAAPNLPLDEVRANIEIRGDETFVAAFLDQVFYTCLVPGHHRQKGVPAKGIPFGWRRVYGNEIAGRAEGGLGEVYDAAGGGRGSFSSGERVIPIRGFAVDEAVNEVIHR
jgi:hypothetical protein